MGLSSPVKEIRSFSVAGAVPQPGPLAPDERVHDGHGERGQEVAQEDDGQLESERLPALFLLSKFK